MLGEAGPATIPYGPSSGSVHETGQTPGKRLVNSAAGLRRTEAYAPPTAVSSASGAAADRDSRTHACG